MLTYQMEAIDSILGEAPELWEEHAQDIGAIWPVGVDVPFYRFLEGCGQLSILTARKDGRMIGYVVAIIRRHPHYVSQLCAFEDGYFLRKSERRGRVGLRLLQEAVKVWKARGCSTAFFHSKKSKDLQALFTYLDAVHIDELWRKDL